MRALALIAVAALLFAGLPAGAVTQLPTGQDGCPNSRAFLEPQLKTRPEDGEYYAIQREAIRMPISRILRAMGGPERAFMIARATRAHARKKIAEGAQGAARRHWQDTILRADALIAILICLGTAGQPT